MQIKIGPRTVGDGCRPFFIAEMSGNHNQSLQTALEIVARAAESGADAIKLQTFTPNTLTLDSHRSEFFINDEQSIWHGMRLWDLYQQAYTPWEWHQPIFARARELGLACISTVFDKRSVDFLDGLNADALKIASFELIHLPLIRDAASINRPIIISTGMASRDEIEDAVNSVRRAGNSQLVLLKCTSSYPARAEDANLATIADLKRSFGCLVGLSDHTMSSGVAVAAVTLGACIVEKHVTLSRSAGGVDASFSLEPHEFKSMVAQASEAYSAIGAVKYDRVSSEQASYWERPSIYAVADIRKGDKFSVENVRVIRPGGGLSPKYYDKLIGLTAATSIERGCPVKETMIETRMEP